MVQDSRQSPHPRTRLRQSCRLSCALRRYGGDDSYLHIRRCCVDDAIVLVLVGAPASAPPASYPTSGDSAPAGAPAFDPRPCDATLPGRPRPPVDSIVDAFHSPETEKTPETAK
eukprot:302035-Pyramimonas_sp.AAC.1